MVKYILLLLVVAGVAFGSGMPEGGVITDLTSSPKVVIHKQIADFASAGFRNVDTPAERIGLQNHTAVLNQQADEKKLKAINIEKAKKLGAVQFQHFTNLSWSMATRTVNTFTYLESWFGSLDEYVPGYTTPDEQLVLALNPDPLFVDGAVAVDVELWRDPKNLSIVYGRVVRWYYSTGIVRCENPDNKLFLVRNVFSFAVPANLITSREVIDRIVERETVLRQQEQCCPTPVQPVVNNYINSSGPATPLLPVWNGRSTSSPTVSTNHTSLSLTVGYWRAVQINEKFTWQWTSTTPTAPTTTIPSRGPSSPAPTGTPTSTPVVTRPDGPLQPGDDPKQQGGR